MRIKEINIIKILFALLYIGISLATFRHSAYGFASIEAGSFWWGALSALAVDAGMILSATELRNRRNWSLVIGLLVSATASTVTQLLFAVTNAKSIEVGAGSLWLTDTSIGNVAQTIVNWRVVILPILLPALSIIYAFSIKTAPSRKKEETYKKCRACKQDIAPHFINESGLCLTCAKRAEGRTHSVPMNIAIPVLDRDEWMCYYCGKDVKEVGPNERHIDHFIPQSKEGRDIVDNLVTSCRDCNLSKGDRMPTPAEQWDFAHYLKAKAAGQDKKTQILTLAFSSNGDDPVKQTDIARILKTSQGYISSVIKEAERRSLKTAQNAKPK